MPRGHKYWYGGVMDKRINGQFYFFTPITSWNIIFEHGHPHLFNTPLIQLSLFPCHHIYKLLKKISAVMGPRTGFRMILD